ncbi:MAG: Rieske 2Fe-2S domain-containing protein [Actinomycetota bacterium]|nr:Rieske 2Fe-2S domain-containing protein [Actinomycetota bacterium]
MRATSIGHAGILVDTLDGSIACDPWFLPQFFGSWFVFPRNDQLSPELMHRICNPDYLYISHIHADHLDEEWLVANMNKDTKVLIPGYPTRELERIMRRLGFRNIIRTVDREEMQLGPNLRITIHCEISITDGPGGDSALVITDGTGRLLNQNDCRTSQVETLAQHGEVDLHWIQYSGAIWYPMVYEETPERMRELVDAKVDSQFTRAMRYVDAIDARAVVPSAGPPAFLDPDLWFANVITGDELSIFPDQRSFMSRLADAGRTGILAIPGTEIEFDSAGEMKIMHPMPQADVDAIFANKEAYLREYQADWTPWLEQMRSTWHPATPTLLATLKAWWEPLMAMAPTLCDAVGDVCVLHAGQPGTPDCVSVVIDFPNRQVREWVGEAHSFRFTIQRELVETVVAQRANDWSNALFLSCRFTAWRAGSFNEYLYNFFKSLSVERMRRAEAEAVRKHDPDRGVLAREEFELDGWIIERTCPHRQADLKVFGEIDGDEFVCTLHGWRFDLATGACRNAADHQLRVRRADS